MYLPCDNMRKEAPAALVRITAESAARWGEAGDDARAYASFCAHLAAHSANRAFALAENNRFVSTALIHETEKTYGLYYFATMPDCRRRGLAAKLKDGVIASLPEQKPLVLLATEAGLPFYINYGFKIIDQVPIYSASEDI